MRLLTRLCVIYTLLYVLSCTTLYKWLFILVYVFVIHNSLRMTIHIIFGFCHEQLCMNDYPYYFCFTSRTYLYKWLSILFLFLSCTSLYEWVSIIFLVFVMHISVRMSINNIFGFRHAHLCSTDYPYYFWFSSCNFVRMAINLIFGFCHSHICTNEYQYYFWISSCTCLYEWISILFLVFVMHMFVRMTIHILFGFRHVHVCTNDYPYYFWILSCTSLYKWISFQCVSVKSEYFHVYLLLFMG